MKYSKDEASDIWAAAILDAMEKYDEYDPEFLEKMKKDWDEVWEKLNKEDDYGKD